MLEAASNDAISFQTGTCCMSWSTMKVKVSLIVWCLYATVLILVGRETKNILIKAIMYLLPIPVSVWPELEHDKHR